MKEFQTMTKKKKIKIKKTSSFSFFFFFSSLTLRCNSFFFFFVTWTTQASTNTHLASNSQCPRNLLLLLLLTPRPPTLSSLRKSKSTPQGMIFGWLSTARSTMSPLLSTSIRKSFHAWSDIGVVVFCFQFYYSHINTLF